MAELPSLTDIARTYVGYVAADTSKSPADKIQELHSASVALSSTAALSGDQQTLDYLLSDDYRNTIGNLFRKPETVLDPQDLSSPVSRSALSEDATTFLRRHELNPLERYGINECIIKFPAPMEDLRRNVYQRLYVSLGRSNTALPIQSDKTGSRTTYFVVGVDVPLLWKYMIDTYEDVRAKATPEFIASVHRYILARDTDVISSIPPDLKDINTNGGNGTNGNGTHREVSDGDIITVDKIAALLGCSRDQIPQGIALHGAGTTQYARVSVLKLHLTDVQRLELPKFIE